MAERLTEEQIERLKRRQKALQELDQERYRRNREMTPQERWETFVIAQGMACALGVKLSDESAEVRERWLRYKLAHGRKPADS